MSDEPWDADRIAAECKATADAKTAKVRKRRSRKVAVPRPPISGEEHDADPPMRDPATGRMLPGHSGLPGTGRKTGSDTYDPAYAPRVKRWAEMGATVAEIADWLDCNIKTFNRWRHDHPELQEAIKIGRAPNDEQVTRSLYERARGYSYVKQVPIKVKIDKDSERVEIVDVEEHVPADPASIAFFLVNRRPDLWQHKKTIEHGGTVTHITAEQARRELEDFYLNGGGELIEGTATEVQPSLPEPAFVPDDF